MQRLEEEWRSEAERLHGRYVEEIVEACGLCPWAQRARLTGRTAVAVMLPPDDTTLSCSVDQLNRWGAFGASPEVGFLLYPRLSLSRAEFDAFVARMQAAASERHPIGQAPFALAAFHPDARPDLDSAERLIPFLRRSPDPCVQAVRMSVLQRVRAGTPQGTQFVDVDNIAEVLAGKEELSLRDRIARANLDTVRTLGASELAARFADIERDRQATYGALLALEAAASQERA